jgi:hypothetical protein
MLLYFFFPFGRCREREREREREYCATTLLGGNGEAECDEIED